ncbi:enoyl-CoA hydratase/isomerase family protein [Thermomonas sp.]|uniref:enoyl-CoA hydratase/isomerase family protein n=1 Tax=Thermomonas sp. TaxID=1971895 RepID=UPI003782E801
MDFAKLALRETHDGQVLEVALDAPKANILDAAMMAELRAVLAAERGVAGRKALVLRGSGAHFCFGASVPEHQADQVGAMLPQFHALIDDLLSHPVPTIAQVSGFCLGGGFELALACALLFADDSARFAVPEIQLGVFPPVAAVLLPALGAAMLGNRLVLSGETVDADALAGCGLLAGRGDSAEAAASAWIGAVPRPHRRRRAPVPRSTDGHPRCQRGHRRLHRQAPAGVDGRLRWTPRPSPPAASRQTTSSPSARR